MGFFITIVLILSFILVPFIYISPYNNISTTDSLSDQPNQPLSKVSAEQENIDSFDVNPKSGRWDVSDTNTDDYIIDSNLRLISSTNSSTDSDYYATRGLTKSDGKYEYRYKTSCDLKV